MKLRQLLLGLLFCAAVASAQDVITKTDGTKIDAKVEEITETTIRYRKANNPTGPIYTMPVSSVANIVFENGSIERFSQSATPDYAAPNQSQTAVSDAMLLRMNGTFGKTLTDQQKQLMSKAKKYRIIGWTGFGVLLVAGTAIGIGLETHLREGAGIGPLCVGLVGSAAWCTGFCLKANSFAKQAKAMNTYSATIFEDEVLRVGDTSLMAGVNLMNNRMANAHGLGLSLKLNF